MVLNEDKQNPCCIRSYQPGQLTLKDGQCITDSILITDEQQILPWSAQAATTLCEPDFQTLIDQKPDIVLIGTGPSFQFLLPQQLLPLTGIGIGVECMDTAAACRSFVALQAECRRVWAALIL